MRTLPLLPVLLATLAGCGPALTAAPTQDEFRAVEVAAVEAPPPAVLVLPEAEPPPPETTYVAAPPEVDAEENPDRAALRTGHTVSLGLSTWDGPPRSAPRTTAAGQPLPPTSTSQPGPVLWGDAQPGFVRVVRLRGRGYYPNEPGFYYPAW